MDMEQPVLDHGYVKYIDHCGSDEAIIEAARMSTGKGFKGWGGVWTCSKCNATFGNTPNVQGALIETPHINCGGTITQPVGDEKLLKFLWDNKHHTPFEMGEIIIEAKAPLFVFREWHRHRTQSYNEMSARYIPLPDENYYPTKLRIVDGYDKAAKNKQAGSMVELQMHMIEPWLQMLDDAYQHAQSVYEFGLNIGIPKEIARLPVPVARYSRMRAKANLRNWLGFCTLRDSAHAPGAQWEIQQYGDAVSGIIKQLFPRTWELFK